MKSEIQHPSLDAVIHLASIDSTNTEAKRVQQDWAGQNILLYADEQTGGRGRGSRTWYSPPGAGLWMTLLLGRREELDRFNSLFSIFAAVILREVLAEITLPAPGLKWPNDLHIRKRKVAGILTETSWQGDSLKAIILGMGINVSQRESDFPEELQQIATSVCANADEEITPEELLDLIIARFFTDIEMLADRDSLVRRWEAYCPYIGERVQIRGQDSVSVGNFIGLDEEGRALLQNDSGTTAVSAGDLEQPAQ